MQAKHLPPGDADPNKYVLTWSGTAAKYIIHLCERDMRNFRLLAASEGL